MWLTNYKNVSKNSETAPPYDKLTMKSLLFPPRGVLQRRAAIAVSDYILTSGWSSLSSSAASKSVGTHDGSFHCDEALGCFMIRRTERFYDADIVRTRDPLVRWKSESFVLLMIAAACNLVVTVLFFL